MENKDTNISEKVVIKNLHTLCLQQCHEIGMYYALSNQALVNGNLELSFILNKLANDQNAQLFNYIKIISKHDKFDFKDSINKRIQSTQISYNLKQELISLLDSVKNQELYNDILCLNLLDDQTLKTLEYVKTKL